MKFSFLSWNARRYAGSEARLEEADQLITNLDPDVFGLIEFMAKKKVRKLMFERFPEYDFAVTDIVIDRQDEGLPDIGRGQGDERSVPSTLPSQFSFLRSRD